MRKTVNRPIELYTCDGCDYVLSVRDALTDCIALSMPFEGKVYHFHFHWQTDRHDCFRQWTHDPHVMKRSLKEQGFNEGEIENFMAAHLYRKTV